ncbi:MAG: ATP-binding protein, partial [Bacteroidota bacterium]
TTLTGVTVDITEQKHILSQIEYRKALLEAHNEASVDGLLLVDTKGKIISYNHRFVEIWNMPQEIVDEKNDDAALAYALTQLVNPEQFIEKVKWLYNHPSETSSDVLEYKDGKIVQRHGYPVLADDGSYYAWSWTFRDVTLQTLAERKIRESEEQFRSLTQSLPQLIWTTDKNGAADFFNKQWYNYTGSNPEQSYANGWAQYIHPNSVANLLSKWQHSLKTGEPLTVEFQLRAEDGSYKWFFVAGNPIRSEDGGIIKWVGSLTEIQHQKEQREELEKAVAQRTAQLLTANEQLEENNIALRKMNNELESFTYIASHDLQEPLRKIQTFANRIIDSEEQNLSVTGKDYFRRMKNASGRMQMLIEDLLAFSHAGNKAGEFVKTHLAKIVQDVIADNKEIIHQKAAIIEVGKMCDAHVIPFQFRQIITNLITNALKFSSAERDPRVFINSEIVTGKELLENGTSPNTESLSVNKNYCHISVSDNGIGFEPEYSEKIFQIFQRLHAKEEYPGTGIGLSIVKKIVENHKGFVKATSELNKGTRFDIYLPE